MITKLFRKINGELKFQKSDKDFYDVYLAVRGASGEERSRLQTLYHLTDKEVNFILLELDSEESAREYCERAIHLIDAMLCDSKKRTKANTFSLEELTKDAKFKYAEYLESIGVDELPLGQSYFLEYDLNGRLRDLQFYAKHIEKKDWEHFDKAEANAKSVALLDYCKTLYKLMLEFMSVGN